LRNQTGKVKNRIYSRRKNQMKNRSTKESRKAIKKIYNKTKIYFFRKINKIDTPLTKLTEKKIYK
jgi:hypothetical protein